MSFPQIPFELNKSPGHGDKVLFGYFTKNLNEFSYLREKTKNEIQKALKKESGDDDHFETKVFIELWPYILTDVLFQLKKKDSREWNDNNGYMETFFDEKSLGVDELSEVFKGFSEFEGMMYGASPQRYRDHVAHSFRVWIIGHTIFKNYFGSKLNACANENLEISEIEWECMWAIVALCHDVGYPLSEIEKVNQRAKDTLKKQGLRPEGNLLHFTFSPQMLPFHETMIKLMSSKPVSVKGQKDKYLTHLQNKYYLKFLKSFDNLNHGIVSALLISASLIYFLESDLSHDDRAYLDNNDARQFLIRREILRAISSHTCQDIYHLRFDTLSFLLYIVDEIQCWGRPTFEQLTEETEYTEKSSVKVNKFNENAIDIEVILDIEKWDKKLEKGLESTVGKLRKMLRLAVDTMDEKKSNLGNLYFRYEIKDKGNKGFFIALEDKKITHGSLAPL